MALILKQTVVFYNSIADPRVETWFMMGTPFPVLAVSLAYLYVILDYGPKFMQNRKPFNIERLLVLFNVIQIVFCSFIVIEGTRVGLLNYDYKCAAIERSDAPQAIFAARIVWFYFIVKLTDLIDTIFFIARKKEKHVSFLHVYHHWGMTVLSWCMTKFYPGGMVMYIIVLNSFVHVVMYGYYLLTSYNKKFQRSAWWKKHITQLQLFQFGILLLQHLGILLFNPTCNVPRWMILALIPQNLMIFCLFADFYYKAYIKPKPAEKIA